jgi:pimeloyl-ACP methyl ester carboxylesterase
MSRIPSFACIVSLITLAGCATPGRHETRAPIPIAPQAGIVYSASGAGSFFSSTDALAEAVAEKGLPLRVEPVDWSHGYGRILSDHLDQENIQAQGCRLASRIMLQKQAFPETRIHLVAHSAGSAVVLTAVEHLPPGSVEHIVLLAPAISMDYDLRPALRCARSGVDVFCSELDVGYLGLATGIFGTTDRTWTPAAGRVGFRPVVCTPADAELYANLRQHPWHPCLRWTGNRGGHYGGYQPCFLQAFVLPVLLTP